VSSGVTWASHKKEISCARIHIIQRHRALSGRDKLVCVGLDWDGEDLDISRRVSVVKSGDLGKVPFMINVLAYVAGTFAVQRYARQTGLMQEECCS
jgi:hypothetical protein